MSEIVWRVRKSPGGVDENNDPIPSTETREPLQAKAVAPGASKSFEAEARNGESIEHTVYFLPAPDLTNDDQLEVRGLLCNIRVLDWRSAFGTGRRGLEVAAILERG